VFFSIMRKHLGGVRMYRSSAGCFCPVLLSRLRLCIVYTNDRNDVKRLSISECGYVCVDPVF
jgi:hypothetical protein